MIDFKLDENGDLVVSSSGDFEMVTGDEFLAQTISFRLKTVKGDWLLSPEVGADLEQFIGQRQSPEVHSAIKSAVSIELSEIKNLPFFEVAVAPNGDNSVWILVEFESIVTPGKILSFIFDLDLKTGQVSSRDN